MKTLILVRHAESESPKKMLQDYERPLKKEGAIDAEKIGQYLKSNIYIPDYILTSGAQRTLETAQVIFQQLFDTLISIHENRLIYGASVSEMKKLIKNFDNQYSAAMVIGHNPTITSLTNEISNANIDYIPTSGVSIIKYNINKWNDLNEFGELIEFIYPKKLNLI